MRNTLTGLIFEKKISFSCNLLNISKVKFLKFLKSNKLIDDIEPPSGCKNPDEAYADNINKIIYIIEKKHQKVEGSCDEKIQTGLFKLYFFKEYIKNYEIKYIYILSSWFKQQKYNIIINYLKNGGVEVLYENDDIQTYLFNLISSKSINTIDTSSINSINIKPLIKWVGGKTQILETIINKIPNTINTYYEFFIGGGSIMIELLYKVYIKEKDIKQMKIYDINPILIFMYNYIKTNPNLLFDEVIKIKNNYDLSTDKEEFYYNIRTQYNNEYNNICKVAMFIFLNKTCFRGLYRESNNGFNVPYGNYINPNIINIEHIQTLHKLFNIIPIEFICLDFKLINNDYTNNDFIYLDPPYYPINETSFTKYNVNDFTKLDHDVLFNTIHKFPCNYLLSNNDVDYVKNKFKTSNIEVINCKRRINSKNPKQKQNEILIYN